MKRIVGVLLLLILALIITSCGGDLHQDQLESVFDGISYNFDTEISVENIKYNVFLPENFSDNIFYSIEDGELKSETENWIINFDIENLYYSSGDFSFNDEFFNYVLTLKNKLDNEEINYELLPNRQIVEYEFVIDNSSKELIGYSILTSYIPMKLDGRTDLYILIPIKVDVLKTKDDLIETIEKDNFIPYKQFLENEKLVDF